MAFYTIKDIAPSPTTDAAVLCVGSRYLIYASSTKPPISTRRKLSGHSFEGGMPSDFDDEVEEDAANISAASRESLSSVARKVGKEVVGGVKVLGGMGYNALSSYFQGNSSSSGQTGPAGASQFKDRRSSVSKDKVSRVGGPRPARPEIEGVDLLEI
ncbi:hypothetical protein HDU96_005380 [Phlyctochytrium bullatum]|nr:hypothetical protein HDU96_005380 [Phlyctochytrium bullatum]